MCEAPAPFYYMVPTEEDGAISYEIRYALHASNLMTVSLDDDAYISEANGDGSERSPTDNNGQDDVVLIDDSDDDDEDDDVVFVSTTKRIEPKPPQKPLNVVKPFCELTRKNDVLRNNDDEIIIVDDNDDVDVDVEGYDEEEDFYRDLDEKEIDDFDIHNLLDHQPNVQLRAVSEETINNYSRKRQKIWSDDSDDDPTYLPDSPSTGQKGRKRRSSDDYNDTTFVPDNLLPSGPTKDPSVYQNRPLDRCEVNRSRVNFCTRVMDYECNKLPKLATRLCWSYWYSLSIREKRKYLPRSKYAQCIIGLDEPEVKTFLTVC